MLLLAELPPAALPDSSGLTAVPDVRLRPDRPLFDHLGSPANVAHILLQVLTAVLRLKSTEIL